MKVCYVTTYGTDYSRIKILRRGMEKSGIEVFDCSSKIKGLMCYLIVFAKFLLTKSKCDLIVVGFFGQPLIPFIKLFTRKRIVFDAFMSAYNTLAEDKKIVKKKSIWGKMLFWLDKYSCNKADIVIVDTYEHINYFCKTFGLDKQKFRRIFVGADENYFYPRKKNKSKYFSIYFHGNFIPLQGTRHIVEAARLLKGEGISFTIIGRGQNFDTDFKFAKGIGASNIDFIEPQPLKELPRYMGKADICLGIFGDTEKAGLVIPNKAYETLAMGKPLITADSKAVHELLIHKVNVYLCKKGNAKAIANAILDLKNNPSLCKKIGKNGYTVFKKKCSTLVIGQQLKNVLEQTISMNMSGKKKE